MSVTSPKRVLIIRLSAIGDVVFASPLVEACKRRYPDAEIDWLAEGVVRPLIVGMPSIGRVILWPRQEWRALWKEKRLLALFKAVKEFQRELNARNYDLVVDAQGLLKSAFLAWLTGCRDRIGFESKEPNGLFLSKRYPKQITDRISSEYLGLARQLGWETDRFEMVLGLTREDHSRADPPDLGPPGLPVPQIGQGYWIHLGADEACRQALCCGLQAFHVRRRVHDRDQPSRSDQGRPGAGSRRQVRFR